MEGVCLELWFCCLLFRAPRRFLGDNRLGKRLRINGAEGVRRHVFGYFYRGPRIEGLKSVWKFGTLFRLKIEVLKCKFERQEPAPFVEGAERQGVCFIGSLL